MKTTKFSMIINRKHTKLIQVWFHMNQTVVASKHPNSLVNGFKCSRLVRWHSSAMWIT